MSTDQDIQRGLLNEIDELRSDRAVVTAPALPLGQRIRDRLLFLVALMGVDLIALIGMTATLVITVMAMGRPIRIFQASVGLPLGIMAGLLVMKYIQRPRDFSTNGLIVLRDWVPFLFIDFIYENLHDVAGHVMHFDIAGFLYEWDVAIFGVEPTLWAQKFYSPLLTDVMAFSYALYFVFPLVIMFFLSLEGHRRAFRHIAMALTFTFILGFLGYVLFPASPPRYFITELFTHPVQLHGPLLYDRLQGMWDGFSVIGGGAFPSLHVGISTVALIYAWQYRYFSKLYRWIWYLYIPLVISLWVSTVYLRHHWMIDIFAGWAVAYIGYRLADVSLKHWNRLRRRYAFPL
jgi:membrane-associated phospholipid phosphatase